MEDVSVDWGLPTLARQSPLLKLSLLRPFSCHPASLLSWKPAIFNSAGFCSNFDPSERTCFQFTKSQPSSSERGTSEMLPALSHVQFVTAAQLCYCTTKAAVNITQTEVLGCVPIRLFIEARGGLNLAQRIYLPTFAISFLQEPLLVCWFLFGWMRQYPKYPRVCPPPS